MGAKIVPISNKGRKENVEYRTQNRRMSNEILDFVIRHSAFVTRYSPYLNAYAIPLLTVRACPSMGIANLPPSWGQSPLKGEEQGEDD